MVAHEEDAVFALADVLNGADFFDENIVERRLILGRVEAIGFAKLEDRVEHLRQMPVRVDFTQDNCAINTADNA